MAVQWLKRVLGGKEKTAITIEKTSTAPAASTVGMANPAAPPAAIGGRAAEALDTLVLDVRPLDSMFRVVKESIEIAKRTRDVEVFASRLHIACDRLAMVEHHSQKYGEHVDGIEQARGTINALIARGPLVPGTTSKRKSAAPRKTPAKAAPLDGVRQPAGRPDIPVEFAMSPWLSSSRTDDSGTRADKFREDFQRDVQGGEFWLNKIKQAKDNPQERLGVAMKMLPLPDAFREAASAVRATIRQASEAKQPANRQLELLYWLAAIESFCIPYAERARQPGANVMEVGSGAEIVSLPFMYDTLGYAQLDLLTATDKAVIAASWGEPGGHCTLNELHRDLWDRYEGLAIRVHDRRLARVLEQM